MITPAVFLPALLGLSFLAIGLITYRREVLGATFGDAFGLAALGPVFVAAALAAFAGEHFTAAKTLAEIVPRWLPARLFIAYFVGVAHLAAASSFVARRYVRWSAICLAIMFALFVLLMDLPGAIEHPAVRLNWSLAAREATYAMGGLALFAAVTRDSWPQVSKTLAGMTRMWMAGVLVFYGVEHVLDPQYSPGVPDSMLTAAWVPAPLMIAYATGILLIVFGLAMFVEKYASVGAALGGLLMVLLTLALYVPQFFLARNATEQVTALNFVFDTLLFAGTVLVIGRAAAATASVPLGSDVPLGSLAPAAHGSPSPSSPGE
jgi:uncharacterized membrane protein